ncbi:GH25 family lysozyme [Mycobacteroides abscessus]|uniref:GH25 family lysozyme n=1 Tax=Mycobacteroides abscessus TaxID=36809 RepID=UPI0009A605C8|nr:GH25 family lysozyme [Mycobacteroides abscessus]SKF91352.1 gp50 protein [Mycobacteroides abscessus subsp. bolletii]SKG26425.1 gp50 protein [Mycobacteroides abscessus subsp. bolletii]SKH28658.1 gp50 protein [Mycobacteroides abscessus subsp. bolletii]SKH58563.1 gp50 protein [Mycobacteroides abscessus subsp. bolletii]SKH89837.1 gp50 protein [Mycobacteroides abscessus subsp. bolletii]
MRYWPLDAGRIVTSPFGPRDGGTHTGTDFGFPGGSAGRPVYAVQAGTVIYAGAAQGYGSPDPAGWLVIDSDERQGGGVFEYGHIVREVGAGAKVAAGQRIGRINPDSATNGGVAPHLHLSYMPREYNPARKQDPMPVLTGAAEPGSSTPPTQPSGGKPVTIFGIDISNNNGVVDIDRVKAEGFQFVWAKVSEGASFKDTFWPRTRDWCRHTGLLLAGYHYVREGDANAQADTFVSQLGDKTIPAMLDFEDGSGGIENFWAVRNAIEARGVRVALSYIPRWYWEKIGKPDLSGVPGLIQSSYVTGTGYASVLYPGDDNSRWAPFGGKAPDILQFTSQAQVAGKILDANAFRGTVEDLTALLRGGPTVPGEPEAPDYDRETWDQLRLRWEMLGWQTFIEAFAEVRDKVLGTNDHGKTGVRS